MIHNNLTYFLEEGVGFYINPYAYSIKKRLIPDETLSSIKFIFSFDKYISYLHIDHLLKVIFNNSINSPPLETITTLLSSYEITGPFTNSLHSHISLSEIIFK